LVRLSRGAKQREKRREEGDEKWERETRNENAPSLLYHVLVFPRVFFLVQSGSASPFAASGIYLPF
jgi:hypothetical protein